MRDIDQIIQQVVNTWPQVNVRQLEVLHPGADDDGLWFFMQPDSSFEVQIESPYGMCPFLIETEENENRFTARTIEEAAKKIAELLHLESSV